MKLRTFKVSMRSVLLIFFCHIVIHVSAQPHRVTSFGVEEGLPDSRVVVLFEDLNGYLWIGTYGGGVARFDGRKFETFDESNGLANSVTLGLQSDSKGNMWVSTPLGISKFDGNTFTNFKGGFERGFCGVNLETSKKSVGHLEGVPHFNL